MASDPHAATGATETPATPASPGSPAAPATDAGPGGTRPETVEERVRRDYKIWHVIGASSAGTVIEWYDFYIFGSLATTISPKFYPEGNDTLALIAYLSTFAVGFVVRPFGALFFGRIGDLVGRKYAFLVTLLIMGGATAAVGLLPGYGTIGFAAPLLLLTIRVLQGLALGGEYGGAAVYVAEHVPDRRRGFYTSFIQITATFGLFLSLIVILVAQNTMSDASFESWGWRLPFLLSVVLVGASLYIRLRMQESPIFSGLKTQGQTSITPIKDAFATRENRRRMALSLFGATAGQGVVWYTGQFYALFYLQKVLWVDTELSYVIVAVALAMAVPLFVVFGSLSDRIGRKRIMMAGCLLAVVSYLPIYKGMQIAAGNDVRGVDSHSVEDATTDRIELEPYTIVDGERVFFGEDDTIPNDDTNPNEVALVLLVFVQVVLVCMVYGPIAAYLVEAFPAKVRYTSMSLPYHIGNGVFGGLLPLIGLAVCAATNSIFAGLAYPMVVAAITFVVGTRFLPETKDVRIWDELEATRDGPPAGQPATATTTTAATTTATATATTTTAAPPESG
jgi:MFS family permease